MLPQNNIIKIKIYMNQYFEKNIVQYYFHWVFIQEIKKKFFDFYKAIKNVLYIHDKVHF